MRIILSPAKKMRVDTDYAGELTTPVFLPQTEEIMRWMQGLSYEHENKYITIKALMRIRLQKRYKPDCFTFDVLKAEYGIYAVRGPRGIPNSLSAALKK